MKDQAPVHTVIQFPTLPISGCDMLRYPSDRYRNEFPKWTMELLCILQASGLATWVGVHGSAAGWRLHQARQRDAASILGRARLVGQFYE